MRKIPYEFQRDMVRYQKFASLRILKPLIYLRVFLIRPRVDYLEINQLARCFQCMHFDARFVRYIRRVHDSINFKDIWVNLQVYGIPDPPVLPCDVFHRVGGPEAEMHIPVEALIAIGIMAPIVSTGRRDLDASFPQFHQRIQAPVLLDHGKIPAIREVVKRRDRVLEERVSLRR